MCATPRSGSTLLCALLAGAGVAGRPEEYFECLWRSGAPRQPREYFAGVDDLDLLALLAPSEPGKGDRLDPFPSVLERGTTENGVFGTKLMWTHLLDLADRLERPADPALLAERLPEPRYVHVTRADKVAQAVSLWRAVQTLAWRAWFAANRIEPLTIAYEARADDARAVTASVLEHVGAGPAEIPEPPLRRQGDDRSARWVERFRSEREAVAP